MCPRSKLFSNFTVLATAIRVLVKTGPVIVEPISGYRSLVKFQSGSECTNEMLGLLESGARFSRIVG